MLSAVGGKKPHLNTAHSRSHLQLQLRTAWKPFPGKCGTRIQCQSLLLPLGCTTPASLTLHPHISQLPPFTIPSPAKLTDFGFRLVYLHYERKKKIKKKMFFSSESSRVRVGRCWMASFDVRGLHLTFCFPSWIFISCWLHQLNHNEIHTLTCSSEASIPLLKVNPQHLVLTVLGR